MNLLDMLDEHEGTGEKPKELVEPQELVDLWRASKPVVVAFDTESPHYKWHLPENAPFAATFSWGLENTYYLSLRGDGPDNLDPEAAAALYGIMTSTPELVAHNAKYDLHVARRIFSAFGFPLVVRKVHDTMLLSHVLNEQRGHALKDLCKDAGITYFEGKDADAPKKAIEEWMDAEEKNNGARPNFDDVPPRLMVPYASQDAYLTYELFRQFRMELMRQQEEGVKAGRTGNDVLQIYEDVELPALWVYAGAEYRGMRVDRDFVYKRIAELTPVMEQMKAEMRDILGWDINPGSSEDVMKALVEHDLAEEKDFLNKRTGKPNLPEWVLESIEHPIAEKVLAYRMAQKMVGSYFETIAEEAQEDETGQWIIRCNVKQVGARTGRSSVTEPALQTLPKKKANVRGAFIARENHSMIFADYSQQELRVLAHYLKAVGDDSMAAIFREGLDLHTETAKAIFRTEEPTKDERSKAKNVNFAIVYGAGLAKIGSMLDISREEAQTLMNTRYYERFPGLRILKRHTEQAMKNRGYVITIFGRRHREKDDKYAYRAINSLVQGTSADMTKAAIVQIDKKFRRENLAAMVLLTVHDEIIVEAPDEEIERAGTLTLDGMLDFPILDVLLDVDIRTAKRWSEQE